MSGLRMSDLVKMIRRRPKILTPQVAKTVFRATQARAFDADRYSCRQTIFGQMSTGIRRDTP
jgi:hypothetical protein